MAKGQVRGNKEAKKPKQPKNPIAPAVPFGSSAAKGAQTPEQRKK